METILSKVQFLNSVLQQEVPYLNRGGCGRFCVMLSDTLDKLGIQHEILIADAEARDKRDTLNNLVSNDYKGYYPSSHLAFSHVFIRIGDNFLDGHFTGEEFEEFWCTKIPYHSVSPITKNQLKYCIKHGYWNTVYDTNLDNHVRKLIELTILN